MQGPDSLSLVTTRRTKQFYMFIQKEWIEGDPGQPPPPPERKNIRNKEWKHMHIEDILSMPDKWEYPFFAIWDSVGRRRRLLPSRS